MTDVTGPTEKPTDDEVQRASKLVKVARAIGNFLLKNWIILGFGIACVLAYFFPSKQLLWSCMCFDHHRDWLTGLLDVAARGGIIRSEYSVLCGVIGLIFFINGMQLSPEKLKQHITNWRLHTLVQGIGFIMMPIAMLSA